VGSTSGLTEALRRAWGLSPTLPVGTFHAGVNHTLTNDAFERAEGSEENVFEAMCAFVLDNRRAGFGQRLNTGHQHHIILLP